MDKKEFDTWSAITESSRHHWIEDDIYRLNGRGVFYFTGGKDGMYMRADMNGLVTAGRYEGAIPHIGEAMFRVETQVQREDFNAAHTRILEAGGLKLLFDLTAQNFRPQMEKPSLLEQLDKHKKDAPMRTPKERSRKSEPER